MKEIKVATSEMEVVRCAQWDSRFGGKCYGLKPKCANAYYMVGSKEECQAHLKWLESLEV